MKVELNWTQGMQLSAKADEYELLLDAKAPIGKGQGATPKELVAIGIGGCTAMDVLALLKKHRQPLESFSIDLDVSSTQGVHPAVFTEAVLNFHVTGAVDPQVLLESVKLSQTKFCGVSAMLSRAFPIRYRIELNGENIGEGKAEFT